MANVFAAKPNLGGADRCCPRRGKAAERGSELVEAALIVTILLTFLIGSFWIARGFNVYQTMRRAAREGARFAVAPTCSLCGNEYPTDEEVRDVIEAALAADSLDPTLVTPNPIPILRAQELNPDDPVVETGVIIAFNYPLTIYLPFTPVGLSEIALNVHIQMREEK